ncbi:MAG: asparagine synthase (glutamine-hydrolyzing) [Candidatus Falkowbacteria bacterium]|nr:asparagine synthase (glutamine-hydrolyzing) [Candidatus Falkowbacteria bacterium]
MCGIAGKIYFNPNRTVSADTIKKMTDCLAHRGPDDSGVFIAGQLGLGHRRLAVIDLSAAGHEPMSDAENKIYLIYNGEIYNFLELRNNLAKDGVKFKSKTDAEVIIYLYKKYGVDCLKYLRGMFAFAIWDSEQQLLFLARDPLGKKPLKYYYDDNCFIFASELKAILVNDEVKKEPDFSAIDEYLTYKYVPCPKTGFKNIYKLPPASYLIVKANGELIVKKYWDLDFSQKLDLSEEQWQEKIINKLIEATRLRLISDVPLGVHLSGGIDSGLITAIIAKDLGIKPRTFTVGFQETTYDERPLARKVATKYQTEHYEFVVEPKVIDILPELVYHYEEPYADASALPTWYLSQITKKQATVAINGDGGDENFAGYERYNAMRLHSLLKKIPGKNILKIICNSSRATNIIPLQKLARLLSAYSPDTVDFYLRIIEYFSPEQKNLLYSHKPTDISNSRWHSFSLDLFKKAAGLDWLDQLLYVGISSHLPDDLLVKTDIAAMAHGLELRSPFLDKELIELTAQMPSALKMRGHNKKYLLKKIAEKYLPADCIYHPKKGFTVPLSYWFRGDLNKYISSNITDKRFLNYGFNQGFVETMLKNHSTGKKNYENQLWSLLMLRLWFKQWFE